MKLSLVLVLITLILTSCTKRMAYEEYIKNYASQLDLVSELNINNLTCQKTKLSDLELEVCVYHVLIRQKVFHEVMDTYYCFSFFSSGDHSFFEPFFFQTSVDECPSKVNANTVQDLIKDLDKYSTQLKE